MDWWLCAECQERFASLQAFWNHKHAERIWLEERTETGIERHWREEASNPEQIILTKEDEIFLCQMGIKL